MYSHCTLEFIEDNPARQLIIQIHLDEAYTLSRVWWCVKLIKLPKFDIRNLRTYGSLEFQTPKCQIWETHQLKKNY